MINNLITSTALVIHLGGNPESAAFFGKQVLASNMGSSSDSAEDGDGKISLISEDGKLIDENYLPIPGEDVLDSPLGITVSNNNVYVADVRRIVGFSLINRKKFFESKIPIPGVDYLNDIVDLRDGRLFVTATNIKKSFFVDTATGQWSEFLPGFEFKYVNGVAFDEKSKTLYLAENRDNILQNNNGTVMAFDLNGTAPLLIWRTEIGRFIDGITVLSDGTVAVTDWGDENLNGIVHWLSQSRGTRFNSQLMAGKGLADLDIHKDGGQVFAAMVDGDIRLILPSEAITP